MFVLSRLSTRILITPRTFKLVRFSRARSSGEDFNNRNRLLTGKLLKQGYRYHTLRKTLAKFYFRNLQLISKYKCNLRALFTSGISHPELYGGVINKRRKIIGHNHFQTLSYKRIMIFVKKGSCPL